MFGVRGWLWSGWWSNYIWSADRGGEIAADGRIETAGESAIHADIGCLRGHGGSHGGGLAGWESMFLYEDEVVLR